MRRFKALMVGRLAELSTSLRKTLLRPRGSSLPPESVSITRIWK